MGAVTAINGYEVPELAVMADLNGVALPVSFAGLSPGMPGIYQVNIVIPASAPPGLDLPLVLRQGSVLSHAAAISVQ
jgi:uncharacterized protein (TIGR03437 family)